MRLINVWTTDGCGAHVVPGHSVCAYPDKVTVANASRTAVNAITGL